MGTVVAIILLVLVVGLAIFAVARSVRIVPQARAGIVERFGRYHRTLHAGLNVVVPFIDRLRPLIDMREQVVSFPPQPVITMDNLVVGIDTVIYFQVTDPRAATYEIANYVAAVEQLTVTTLRNVVGGMDLDMTLTSRDKINGELRKELDEATGRWGLRVSRVELKAIEPPASIQDSMEKQMRADRDKRAAILSAEGAKQSAILTAEGARQAAVLRARGEAEATVVRADAEATAQATRARGEAQAIATVFQAIHEGNPDQRLLAYKYLEMLPEIAQGGANKLWIVPSELGKALEGIGGFFGNAGSGAADAGRHRQIQDPPDELPGQDGSGSITRLPLLPAAGDPGEAFGLSGTGPCGLGAWNGPDLDLARVADPSLERRLPGGRRPVPHGTVTEPEGRPVPRAGDAGIAADAGDPSLVQRPAQVRAVVGEYLDGVAAAHREHAQVAKLAPDRPSLRQLRQGAQVVPAQCGEVPDGLGMARPGPEPQGEVAAQVTARRGGGEPGGGQQVAGTAPPGRPGQQRAREQRGRGGLRDGVHQSDPLLMPVKCRPVREPGGGGGHRGDDPGRDQGRRGALSPPAAAQVK